MTEKPPSTDRPAYTLPAAPPRPRARPLYWLVVVALLAGAGLGGWHAWRWATGALGSLSAQQELLQRQGEELARLRAQADALAAGVQKNGGALAAMEERVAGSEQVVSRLADTLEGGRVALQLAAVEQLLLLANDRLLLAHDANAALRALDLADQRLAAINDPQLFKVREALARERSALTALALPDTTSLALTLAELSRKAPGLPLKARARPRYDAESAPAAPAPASGAFGRLWGAVKSALASIFTVRRSDAPPPRLLMPEEQALVAQILQLKVEGARLALMAHDARSFRALAGEAADWLTRHYDEADADVRAARAELQRVSAAGATPDLPDIGKSLALLRGRLGAPRQ